MFALISSAFALLEGTAPVRDTPSEMAALKREILELDEELEFRHQLASWQVAINYAQRRLGSGKQFHYFLLVLDSDAKSLTIKSYPRDQVRQAERDLEKEQDIGTFRDVVLVAAPGLKNLLKAYPNYQLDTDLFLAKLDQVLGAAA